MGRIDWRTVSVVVSVTAAIVSVLAALINLYFTRKRMQFDAAREPGEFRAETMAVLHSALLLDHPTWSIGCEEFQRMRPAWGRLLDEKEPVLGRKVAADLNALEELLQKTEAEIFGVVRVFADDDETDMPTGQQMSDATGELLRKWQRRLAEDRRLLTR